MSFYNVIRLYSSIVAPIYSDWISAVDLCKLDTAVCNNNLRQHLLDTMNKCSLYHFGEEDLMAWIAMRGMGVHKWSVSSALSETDKQVLTRSGYLKELSVHDTAFLSEVLDICPVVHALQIYRLREKEFLEVLPRLSGIHRICISFCKVTGSMIQGIIDHIPELREARMDIDTAKLIEGCIRLETLEVPFSRRTMDALSKLSNLRSLSFYTFTDSPASDSDMMILLHNCHGLEKFRIVQSRLTDSFTASLARSCPRLTHFDSGGSHMTDDTLLALGKCCPQLTVLKISSDKVTDAGVIAVIHGCPLLVTLSVNTCFGLTDKFFLTALRCSTRLTHLSACDACLTDAAVCGVFGARPTLECVNVSCPNVFSSITSQSVISNMINLESMVLSDTLCYLHHTWSETSESTEFSFSVVMSESDYAAVFANCPHLLRLSIRRKDFYNGSVKTLMELCHDLTMLFLWDCSVSFEVFIGVIGSFPKLKQLGFGGSHVDTACPCFEKIFSCKFEWLTSICFESCPLNDVTLDNMAECCPILREINLQKTRGVTSSGVNRLLQSCATIVRVTLIDCPFVGIEVLRNVVETGRKLFFLCIADYDGDHKPVDPVEKEYLVAGLKRLVKVVRIQVGNFNVYD